MSFSTIFSFRRRAEDHPLDEMPPLKKCKTIHRDEPPPNPPKAWSWTAPLKRKTRSSTKLTRPRPIVTFSKPPVGKDANEHTRGLAESVKSEPGSTSKPPSSLFTMFSGLSLSRSKGEAVQDHMMSGGISPPDLDEDDSTRRRVRTKPSDIFKRSLPRKSLRKRDSIPMGDFFKGFKGGYTLKREQRGAAPFQDMDPASMDQCYSSDNVLDPPQSHTTCTQHVWIKNGDKFEPIRGPVDSVLLSNNAQDHGVEECYGCDEKVDVPRSSPIDIPKTRTSDQEPVELHSISVSPIGSIEARPAIRPTKASVGADTDCPAIALDECPVDEPCQERYPQMMNGKMDAGNNADINTKARVQTVSQGSREMGEQDYARCVSQPESIDSQYVQRRTNHVKPRRNVSKKNKPSISVTDANASCCKPDLPTSSKSSERRNMHSSDESYGPFDDATFQHVAQMYRFGSRTISRKQGEVFRGTR